MQLPSVSRPRRRAPVARTDEEVEELFRAWYAEYPRHVAPGAARRAYRTALKKTSPLDLSRAARRYAEQTVGRERRLVKHPASWLNGEGWLSEDEESAVRAPRSARRVVEREMFADRGADFARHFLDYVVAPAARLGLAGAEDSGALAEHLGHLYLRVIAERGKLSHVVREALPGGTELVRRYLDWLSDQGWHSATLAVLGYDSPAFAQFRRELALEDQHGRDPISGRSRFSADARLPP